MITLETGRMRPPSEAESMLLRITRGCHWNKCVFCPVYKQQQCSIRKVDEIKRDIDAMAVLRGQACYPSAEPLPRTAP